MEYKARVNFQIKLITAGVAVGIISGIVVSAFRWLIHFISDQVVAMYHYMRQYPSWIVLWIILSAMVAIVLSIITATDDDIKGSGIPQVELQVQGHLAMNWWSVLWKKFVVGSIAIGSGLFLGREGPSIQLGSVIGLGMAKFLDMDQEKEGYFVSSGASAGIAAAFNAPLAGLMFVLEEVYHKFDQVVILMVFVSALVANEVSIFLFGSQPSLALANTAPFPVEYNIVVVILGVLLAFGGFLYYEITLKLPQLYRKVFPRLNSKYYGIVPFLLVIPIGLWMPSAIGGGGGLILDLVLEQQTIQFLLILFVIRFVFSMISYGSGLPGGIFLPILSLGALLGLIFAEIAVEFFGFPRELVANIVMFAMAGFFASISKAPLTAILLVSEMVAGITQLMPIGICVISAYFTANVLGMKPIYEVLAERMLENKTQGLNRKEINN